MSYQLTPDNVKMAVQKNRELIQRKLQCFMEALLLPGVTRGLPPFMMGVTVNPHLILPPVIQKELKKRGFLVTGNMVSLHEPQPERSEEESWLDHYCAEHNLGPEWNSQEVVLPILRQNIEKHVTSQIQSRLVEMSMASYRPILPSRLSISLSLSFFDESIRMTSDFRDKCLFPLMTRCGQELVDRLRREGWEAMLWKNKEAPSVTDHPVLSTSNLTFEIGIPSDLVESPPITSSSSSFSFETIALVLTENALNADM